MVSDHSIIQTEAIGAGSEIAEYCVIRPGAVLGEKVVLHPHVVIESGVIIGDNVEIYPGAYVGKAPKGVPSISRPLKYEKRLTVAPGCVIGPHAVIYYDVSIGENTLIGDGASLREGSHIGPRCVIGRYVTVNYNTFIGSDVKIMDHSWLAGNMRIGNHVFISGGVQTTNDNYMSANGYSEDHVIGPEIEDHVRIGVS